MPRQIFSAMNLLFNSSLPMTSWKWDSPRATMASKCPKCPAAGRRGGDAAPGSWHSPSKWRQGGGGWGGGLGGQRAAGNDWFRVGSDIPEKEADRVGFKPTNMWGVSWTSWCSEEGGLMGRIRSEGAQLWGPVLQVAIGKSRTVEIDIWPLKSIAFC